VTSVTPVRDAQSKVFQTCGSLFDSHCAVGPSISVSAPFEGGTNGWKVFFFIVLCLFINAFDERTVAYSYRMISDYLIEKYIEESARRQTYVLECM